MTPSLTTRCVPTRFGRETRFEITPKVVSERGDQTRSAFEQLKARLLSPLLRQAPDLEFHRQLRLAANEAAAVAWTTGFPLLTLPVLLEEKAAELSVYVARQEQVHRKAPVLTG